MQEAVKKYIKIELKNGKDLTDINNEIDRVRIYEIKKARVRQRIQLRKNSK